MKLEQTHIPNTTYFKMKYSDDSNPFWFEVLKSGQFIGSPVKWYSGYIVDQYGVAAFSDEIEIHSTDLYYAKPAGWSNGKLEIAK